MIRNDFIHYRLILLLLAGLSLPLGAHAAEQRVVVVLDDSGSMNTRMGNRSGKTRMQAAKSALETVLADLPAGAEVGVLALNGYSGSGDRWVLPLGQHSKQEARQAVRNLRAAGGTPLGNCLKIGSDALLAARERNRYGTYRLLVVTDGEATDGRLVERYLPDILARGLTVDVIGVDMKNNHSLATQVHNYRRADDEQALKQGIAAVFAESDPNNDTAEADFALLEGFPPEMAAASLTALAEIDNRPIGTQPKAAVGARSSADSAAKQNLEHRQNQEKRRKGKSAVWLALVMVAVMILAIRFGRRALRNI